MQKSARRLTGLPSRVGKGLALLVALATMLFVGVATAAPASAAPPVTNAVTVPVTGTGTGNTFAGNLDITRFATQNGQLVALGTLTGTLTNTATGATQAVNEAITLPVSTAQTTASCQILDLVLGPLDLNLLGLVVHLDTVHLNITAQQGPGNLLGNLLCSVAHLLDGNGNGVLNGVAALLNRILSILG
jgi:hypothetical protein